MRCVRADDDNGPCRRCLSAGVDCVFDPTTSRRSTSGQEQPAKRQKLHTLTQELDDLKAQMATISQSQAQVPFRNTGQPSSTVLEDRFMLDAVSTSPSQPQHEKGIDECPTFSPENLSVPVTAVHVMIHPSSEGEAERNSAGWTVENQSRWNRADHDKERYEDVVTQQNLDEIEARKLFDVYMRGANLVFPIFDPVLDTFDSIRERSQFTFTVILYVAARHQHAMQPNHPTLHVCKEDALKFAAASLFENPSSIDTVEAMLILAVHSNKTWFALGHTVQMATDLGLHHKMRNMVRVSPAGTSRMSSRDTRFALRCARIWLLIVQYDCAIGFGTIRQPRAPELLLKDLEHFLDNANPHPFDISSCASIDLYQYLIRLQMGKEPPSIDNIQNFISEWFSKWNVRLEDNYVHKESFQRSYLKIQELYARVIVGGMMFVHLLKLHRQESAQLPLANQELVDTGRRTLHLVQDVLVMIDGCSSYKALFSWSPTYEGLLLTFVMVLGFQILFMYPDPVATQALLQKVDHTATLLQKHHCPSFHRVVQRLVHRARNLASDVSGLSADSLSQEQGCNTLDFESILQGTDWTFDLPAMSVSFDPFEGRFPGDSTNFMGLFE